jgi:hypothetical protein
VLDVGDVHDQGMICRPPFDAKDAFDGRRVRCIGTKPVDGLSRQTDDST